MTPDSETSNFMPVSPCFDSQEHRAMVRHLLSKYSRHEIDQLLEEVAGEAPCELLTPMLPYAASLGPLIADNVSAGAHSSTHVDKYQNLTRHRFQRSASGTSASLPSQPSISPRSSVSSAPGHRAGGRPSSYRSDYACGFCAEVGITKTCTRRNDLRRHIDQFHNTNSQWLCQHRGCRMAFDWQTAYQIHLRSEHGGSQMRMEEAKVVLCPQTVFACGYEGCLQVFEATDDNSAAATWKVYTAHLIRHCEEGRGMGLWSYSQRMRNLLRQSRLEAAWSRSWPDDDPSRLRWDPASTRTLRKLLETRHLENVPKLINCVVLLGSSHQGTGQPDVDLDLHLPVRKVCPAAAVRHEMRTASPPAQTAPEEDANCIVDPNMGPQQNTDGAQLPLSSVSFHAPGFSGYTAHDSTDAPMTPPPAIFGLPGSAVYHASSQPAHQQYASFEPTGRSVRPTAMSAVAPLQPIADGSSGMLGEEFAMNDTAAVPRGQHYGWTHVYRTGGLQSPTLTDVCNEMGSPLVPVEQGLMGSYCSPRTM
ncbi:zinc finger domain-containing protein [Purpureocillium lilacinum]|uniref:Zinc finger domain-containing protein n=1 Tax=Purpureocillium lilacinum TaxID=33203 RepID=A0A179GVM0_PURLI|nr:zinc finger domain-containing protein [Purpureocillium lilacinum]